MATDAGTRAEPDGAALSPDVIPEDRQALVPSRRRRRRIWMFRLLTLAFIVVAQELFCRWEFPFPAVHKFNRISYQMMAQSHQDLSRVIERGLVYDRLLIESQEDGFSEIHGLNMYGFRGADFSIAPQPGRRRVLLVGDSVTEGMGAGDAATIARELERRLTRSGQPVEVINLGVIAASLDHVTILARDATRLLHPADVVVVLYANDLPASFYNPLYDQPGPEFPPWIVPWWKPRMWILVERFILEKPFYHRWPHLPIRFFRAVPDPANPWSGGTKKAPPELDPMLHQQMTEGKLNPWLSDQSTGMPQYLAHDFSKDGSPERHFARIAEVCRSANARLIIAYVPFCGVVSAHYVHSLVRLGMDPETAQQLSLDPLYRRQNRELAEVCSRLRLPLADTTEDLIQAEHDGTRQYWEYDTHPRPAGYATIARTIERVFRAAAPPQ